jgi:hypothetical protein
MAQPQRETTIVVIEYGASSSSKSNRIRQAAGTGKYHWQALQGPVSSSR